MTSIQNWDQAAGNTWGDVPPSFPHQAFSTASVIDLDFSYTNSTFDDLEQQMRISETEFTSSVRMLREKYVLNDEKAVEAFVKTHRMIAPLLIEAAPQLSAAFGNQALLALELLPNEDSPESIYALAIWGGDSAEARTALHAFDEGWLRKNFQAINGRVVFDFELT